MRAALLGLGSWGTALAGRARAAGHEVVAWTRDPEQRRRLLAEGENAKYLPGVPLPEGLRIVDTPEEAVAEGEIVLLCVPSFAVRETAGRVAPALGDRMVINAAKGLEEGTLRRPLEVLAETLGPERPVASLVGPSHAEEVSRDHPTAVVATARREEAAPGAQRLLSGESFRVYTNDDTLGVELAAALKNVIALAAGIAAGLGYGDNTLGALVTRGLAEMTRLGARLGARPETFYGLAGVGDLVTTCVSRHSRNRRVGEAVGRGMPLPDVLRGMTMVAEGVYTTRAARELGRRTGVELPIVDRVHAVLFAGEDPRTAMRSLMTRELKAERPGGDSRGSR